MGLLQKFNEKVQGWLFKEEIEFTEQRRAEGLPVTPEEFEAQHKAELERMERVTAQEMKKILAENHNKKPSQADINRYYTYHENYVDNMKGLEKHIGGLWTKAPENQIRLDVYNDEAHEKGWDYLRNSCGMPTGDLNKPRSPWIAMEAKPNWTTKEDKSFADTNEVEPEKPKVRKRGI